MNIVGIIPARGGSKRVPGKNIRLLNGKPLIQYTIDTCKASQSLTYFMVSTDDEEIATVAKAAGASVPFMRPAELAVDTMGDRPVLQHVVSKLEADGGEKIDAIIILRPTAPFRTVQMIDEIIELFQKGPCDSVRSMTRVEGVHHPYWMFREKDGVAHPVIEGVSLQKYYQSQLLPSVYRLNGMIDMVARDVLFDETKGMYGNVMRIYETEERLSIDIDNLADFEYCEWLMKNTPKQ